MTGLISRLLLLPFNCSIVPLIGVPPPDRRVELSIPILCSGLLSHPSSLNTQDCRGGAVHHNTVLRSPLSPFLTQPCTTDSSAAVSFCIPFLRITGYSKTVTSRGCRAPFSFHKVRCREKEGRVKGKKGKGEGGESPVEFQEDCINSSF